MICTLDRHFYDPPVLEFCRMRNIRVMTDVELLTLLARKSGLENVEKRSLFYRRGCQDSLICVSVQNEMLGQILHMKQPYCLL